MKKPAAHVLERAVRAAKALKPAAVKKAAAPSPPRSRREQQTRAKVIAALKRLHPMD